MALENKQRRFSSLIVKIIAANCLTLLVCVALSASITYLRYRNDNILYYNDRALAVAETIAASIDGDNFKETVRSGQKSESWRREKAALDSALSRIKLEYLYIIDSDYDEKVTYYMEAETEQSDLSLGDTDDAFNYAAEMFQTIKTGQSTITDVYVSGTYGILVSGFAAIRDSRGDVVGVVGADVSVRDVFSLKHRLEFAVRLLIVLALCAVAPIAIQALFLQRMVGRPVKELTAAAARLGGGDLAVSLSIRTGDEIEKLADTFAMMVVRLNEYIENLTRVTAEKERIGAELDVATKIQTSMLPCIFPAFPHRAEFDIYASMQPAKEVGGDFYDFFLINENKLAVVIADVSGKGVPAALFMVIAKTLIKNNAQYDKSPKEVFETVNNLLCENNEAGMFVTAFMGILDIPSGKFTYANAGHNPPLIKRANGQYEWLPTNPGLMLAGLEDMIYSQDEIQLDSGDILFLYTDGVTEAVDRENRFFEEPRLKDALNAYRGQDLHGLLLSIKREIDNFADGAEQADDITMLAFARR